MSADGPEERRAEQEEFALLMREPIEVAQPKRLTAVLENEGYPVSDWLKVHFDETDGFAEIVQIDRYFDEACTQLMVDGLKLEQFPQDTQTDIEHKLDAHLASELDRQRFAAGVEKWQQSVRRWVEDDLPATLTDIAATRILDGSVHR